MKVIFLDFDGVLNSRRFHDKHRAGIVTTLDLATILDPEAIARVDRICDATGAKIVISSSWRSGYSVDDLTKFLRSRGLRSDVIGATEAKDFTTGVVENRAIQIERWANSHDVEDWLAIDDWKLPLLSFRLVRTSEDTGITDADVERAIELLGRAER